MMEENKNLKKETTLIGIDLLSNIMVEMNSSFLLLIFKKNIKKSNYIINLIKIFTVLLIAIEIYLFKSFIKLNFSLTLKEFLFFMGMALFISWWGRRWFPTN